jgi:hypothetical protein
VEIEQHEAEISHSGALLITTLLMKQPFKQTMEILAQILQ